MIAYPYYGILLHCINKLNRILLHVTTWMSLNIIMSEISQTKKNT